MIHITSITFYPTAPFPGTKYRLIKRGETGKPGDEYFDAEDGQWKPDPSIDDTTPFDPAIHAHTRRLKGPVYKPYDMESIPLPLVIRGRSRARFVVYTAAAYAVSCERMAVPYEHLLRDFTHDDGSPCGILVPE